MFACTPNMTTQNVRANIEYETHFHLDVLKLTHHTKLQQPKALPLPSLYVFAQCVVQLHQAIICRRDIVPVKQTVDRCLQILLFQFGDLQCGLNFL